MATTTESMLTLEHGIWGSSDEAHTSVGAQSVEVAAN